MNLRKKAISGFKWSTVSTLTLALSAILRLSILARFLDKVDFGLMAMVVFVLGFMNLFMDMGLTTAILHKQNISRNEYTSLYWINFLVSIFLYIIIIITSPIISRFYEEKELVNLLPLMGLSLIISAVGRQFKTMEQKELHFKFIAIVDILASIISLVVGTLLAISGYGVYALVYSTLSLIAFSNLTFFIFGVYKHGFFFRFSFKETKPFLKIGMYQVGSDISNYLNRDVDILIIGKLLGAEILGGYNLAKQLVRRPLQIIDPILSRVAMSIFPIYQNDDSKLRLYFEKILTNLSILDALIYGTIAITAPLIVKILYGPGYEDIVLYVQLFTVVVYLRSLSGQQGILVITKGRTDLGFIWNILLMVVFPLVIYLGTLSNIVYVIVYLILIQTLLLVPSWWLFYKKLINMSFILFLKPIILPLLIAMFIFFAFYWITDDSIVYQVIFSFLLATVLGVYAFFRSEEFKMFLFKFRK